MVNQIFVSLDRHVATNVPPPSSQPSVSTYFPNLPQIPQYGEYFRRQFIYNKKLMTLWIDGLPLTVL
jgi:hypothetical protein